MQLYMNITLFSSVFSTQNTWDGRIMGKSCPLIIKIQNYRFLADKHQTKALSPEIFQKHIYCIFCRHVYVFWQCTQTRAFWCPFAFGSRTIILLHESGPFEIDPKYDYRVQTIPKSRETWCNSVGPFCTRAGRYDPPAARRLGLIANQQLAEIPLPQSVGSRMCFISVHLNQWEATHWWNVRFRKE
jgi:hypothetical protein